MNIKKYMHIVHAALQSLFQYRNFLTVWKNYCGLIRADYIIVRLWNGVQYKIRSCQKSASDAYIVNEIWLYGVHNGLINEMQKAKVGIDIGAHIGIFSIFAVHQNPSLKIYAYEPAPDNFQLLKENIGLNKVQNRVIPFAAAVVGDMRKSRDLYFADRAEGLCTINPFYLDIIKKIERYGLQGKGISSLRVNSLMLEDIFNSNKIDWCDFLKMDCEGAEYEILFNAPAHILEKIKTMSIEYHYGNDVLKLKEFLERHNFVVSFPHARLDVILAQRIR